MGVGRYPEARLGAEAERHPGDQMEEQVVKAAQRTRGYHS